MGKQNEPMFAIVDEAMTVSDFGQMLAHAQAVWNERHPPTVEQRKSAERAMFEKWYKGDVQVSVSWFARDKNHPDFYEYPVVQQAWMGWWARANDGEIPEEKIEEGK